MKTRFVVYFASASLLAGGILFSGCGGGGGGNSSEDDSSSSTLSSRSSSSVGSGSSLTTLKDLENMALAFQEYWHILDVSTYTDMLFTDEYYESYLINQYSSATKATLCALDTNMIKTYLCVTAYSDGDGSAHLFNVNADYSISGNYEFSGGADSAELIEVYDRDLSDAWLYGAATSYYSAPRQQMEETDKKYLDSIDVQRALLQSETEAVRINMIQVLMDGAKRKLLK